MRPIALATLSSLWLLACSAAPPPAPAKATRRPPKAWHPAEGTKKIECPAEDAVDPADPSEVIARCEAGRTSSCLGLLEHGRLGEARRAMVTDQLRLACEENPTCGCAAYGEALLESGPAETARALEVLRRSCLLGTLPACDVIDLSIDVCARDPRENVCEALFESGALERKAPLPQFAQVELPPSLTGCFVVDSPVVPFPLRVSKPLPRPDASQTAGPTPFGSLGGASGDICQIDPSACSIDWTSRANAKRGDVYCFELDRISYRAERDDWDQLLTGWLAELDRPIEYHSAQGLRLEARKDGAILRDRSDDPGLLLKRANVSPPPNVESVCNPARACVLALQKAKLPTQALRSVDFDRSASCKHVKPFVRRTVPNPPEPCR